MPRPQSLKLLCAGGPQCFTESGDFVDYSKMENFTAGSPQIPSCLENGLQTPLKDSSAHLYANGLLATGIGFDNFKNGVSAELEYVLPTYLHCKLKFKEGCDGRMNFLADSAISESHNKCVLLDGQSLNWQDEQSYVYFTCAIFMSRIKVLSEEPGSQVRSPVCYIALCGHRKN